MMRKVLGMVGLCLLSAQDVKATFLLTEGETWKGVRQTCIDHDQFDDSFKYTREELEQGLVSDLRLQGIHARYIPQTCWDLFAVYNRYRSNYPLPGQSAVEGSWHKLNNAFVDYLRTHQDVREAFQSKRYDDVTCLLAADLSAHLKRFHKEVRPLASQPGGPLLGNSHEDVKMWLYADSHFPELTDILVKATRIEADCFSKDQVPLWRHSRHTLGIKLQSGAQLSLLDMPMLRQLMVKVPSDNPQFGQDKFKLSLGTLSFGFSLLACFTKDGSLAGLCDYNFTSACSMSYFMQELRDRAYIENRLPFRTYEDRDVTPEEARKHFIDGSTLLVMRLPKGEISKTAASNGPHLRQQTPWYIPNISPYDWVSQSGEQGHPRRLGNIFRNDESFIASRVSNNSTIELALELIEELKGAELLAYGGRMDEEFLCDRKEKNRENYRAFAAELQSGPEAINHIMGQLRTHH
ncbi:MAG: hypothetical protein ACK5O7_07120 [Holosporales bacterium]